MKLPLKKIAGLCGGLIFVGGLITILVVTIHCNKSYLLIFQILIVTLILKYILIIQYVNQQLMM